MTFTANGEYIVGGGDGLGVWRVEDGKQIATMAAWGVWCIAASQDGRWVAAGTAWGEVSVWDAKTFKNVFTHKEYHPDVLGVDFSPDSTRFVTASKNQTATVWDVATRKKVLTIPHNGCVTAAKYSPQGDRIATATPDSVRLYDSNGERLLEIPVKVTPLCNTGLLWSNNHLFVVSDGKIKQLEPSTGSAVSEWQAHDTNDSSCIALPKHEEFIAYSTNDTTAFWDMLTHARLGLIQHTQSTRSIAFSPDDRILAIAGHGGRITITSLSRITVSIVFLWINANLNNFLVLVVFPTRIQSQCLVYIPLSRNLTFRSTMLRLIHGSTINSRMRRRC